MREWIALSVFPDEIKKYGQEINDHQIEVAKARLVNFTGICGDTLKEPAFYGKKFKCIVANAPFSISWEPPQMNDMFNDGRFFGIPAMPPKSKADFAFLLHIIFYLADDGVAVTLNFPGILYRGNSEAVLRKWLVEKNVIDKIIRIPGKTFVDTAIETVVVIFRKNKASTDIEFIDSEKKKSIIVSKDEIIKNNYILSINQYIVDEIIIEEIDASALQASARESTIARLKLIFGSIKWFAIWKDLISKNILHNFKQC